MTDKNWFRYISRKKLTIPTRQLSFNVHQNFMKNENELKHLVIKVSCHVQTNFSKMSEITHKWPSL